MQGNVERFVFQFVKSLRKISFYSKFFKKIKTSEASNNGILICREFPIISVKFYKSDAFILGYHVYKTVRTLSYNRKIFFFIYHVERVFFGTQKKWKVSFGITLLDFFESFELDF